MTIGDRVSRPRFLNDNEYVRHGTVEEVYQTVKSSVGLAYTLYAVRWDDTGLVERGYFERGLKPERTAK